MGREGGLGGPGPPGFVVRGRVRMSLRGSLLVLPQGPAPHEFPGACHRGGDVDQAHLQGFPAPRAHGQADSAAVSGTRRHPMPQGPPSEGKLRHGALQLPSSLACVWGGFWTAGAFSCSPLLSLQHVGLCLQHRAPLDHHRPLPAAPGRHPPPPPGLPGPGRALGGADEEGSGAHRRRGDPAQGPGTRGGSPGLGGTAGSPPR